MNTETAQILCEITNAFYREQSESFSATRQAPWNGWARCVDILRDVNRMSEVAGDNRGRFSVFDLACGNLRFEAFLETELPAWQLTCYAVDDCDDLVPHEMLGRCREADGSHGAAVGRCRVEYQSLDVLRTLLDGSRVLDGPPLRDSSLLHEAFEAPVCDASVSFGFMHHVPSREYREAVLAALVEQTRSGGYVIVSFWQFMNSPALAEKALVTHKRALDELGLPVLDEGDYLLGWKNTPGAYRYCHSFSDDEIDRLVASVAGRAELVERFSADGKTDDLNAYLVLRVR